MWSSIRIKEALLKLLEKEGERENRSASNMLEVILKDRYDRREK